MGAARSNPRAAAFRGERTVPTDGPLIRNTTTRQHRIRFIPSDRLLAKPTNGNAVVAKTGAGDMFRFSDRTCQVQTDGSLRRIHPAPPAR